jgi:hypothetical protein
MATLTTLISFNSNDPDNLIFDAAGDLIGTTTSGGVGGGGDVFEILYVNGSYASTPTTLVSFVYTTDGAEPSPGLVTDAAGDLFGTNAIGGEGGFGTVFEIPYANGSYASTPVILASLYTPADYSASSPSNLIIDAAGDLFGTSGGGNDGNSGFSPFPRAQGVGTVFEIPYVNGSYVNLARALGPPILVNFNGSDGADPTSLIADAAGNLFGTTQLGGANGTLTANSGTVFEVPYTSSYANTATVLVSFTGGADGTDPQNLIIDAAGDLFGMTPTGGADSDGTVFEIPYINGSYASTPITLATFNGADGSDPDRLIIDAAGNLFGTTDYGGAYGGSGPFEGYGTIFEISHVNGSYASSPNTLFNFDGSNGAFPGGASGLIADAAGDLFGTTVGVFNPGSGYGNGTVFEFTDSGFQVPCYCPGTLIRTTRGQKRVEKLEIGDKVMTMTGIARPIKWIGRRSYGGRFIIGRKDILPICIKAGAIGNNVPKRDLWISPHHAMYLEGVLIEAKDLVNGVSVVQAEQVEKVEYFHIELETHDIIVAEGALSETFIDDDSRGMFHNAHEYRALYSDEIARPASYCAPRRDEGFAVEAARKGIALRAGLQTHNNEQQVGTLRGYVDFVTQECIAGWAQNVAHPEAPVCLDICAGSRLIGQTLANRYREDLEQAGLGSGCHSFEFAMPVGLAVKPNSVMVRRSIDGAALNFSADGRRLLAGVAFESSSARRHRAGLGNGVKVWRKQA